MSFLEQEKRNKEESNRLNDIVLNQDYIVGDHYDDRHKLFWEHVKGYNSIPGMIEPCELLIRQKITRHQFRIYLTCFS